MKIPFDKKMTVIIVLVLVLLISLITSILIINKNKTSTTTAIQIDAIKIGEPNIIKRGIPVVIKDKKNTIITFIAFTSTGCPDQEKCGSEEEEQRFTFELVNKSETKKFTISSNTDKEETAGGYKFTYMSGNIKQVSVKIEEDK